MKNKMLLAASLLLLPLLSTAWAAGITGKWTGRAGDVDITLDLKANGTEVTGTINNPLVGETPIKDGKISGDEVSFYVVRTINESEIRVLWRGKVVGDEIRFKREMNGRTGSSTEIVARRMK
jgi:hypothetical protein